MALFSVPFAVLAVVNFVIYFKLLKGKIEEVKNEKDWFIFSYSFSDFRAK